MKDSYLGPATKRWSWNGRCLEREEELEYLYHQVNIMLSCAYVADRMPMFSSFILSLFSFSCLFLLLLFFPFSGRSFVGYYMHLPETVDRLARVQATRIRQAGATYHRFPQPHQPRSLHQNLRQESACCRSGIFILVPARGVDATPPQNR